MTIRVGRNCARRILRWGQSALLVIGVSLLGYCAFVLLDAWLFQHQEIDSQPRTTTAPSEAIALPPLEESSTDAATPLPANGEVLGRLEIPRLGISVLVAEGVDKRTLRRAVGHIPGTAPPGRTGNAGIAGHRDTFFRKLEGIRVDDIIRLTASSSDSPFLYRVVWSRVTNPEDVAVLDPTSDEVLTLVTCYPFYFVGPAPERFIVRAERSR